MAVDAKDVLALLPSLFEGAKVLTGLVSPRASEGVSLGQDVATFILDAETRGLSDIAIIQGVNDLVVQMTKRYKFGG